LKKRWLPRLAIGEAVGCFALTEPQGGSDPANMKVTARRVGDEFVLNGHKRWSTNGLIADIAVVWAKDEESGKIHGFLVETDREGFEARGIPGRASLRASV
jgi:glutaryl-CoA dehydrogenase